MANLKNETLQMQSDRSSTLRANIKRYYIYAVLLLIVSAFSLMKLDEVEFFGRGHFLSPDSVINIFRSAVPILTVSGAFTLLMISGYIDLSVGSAMSLNAVVFSWMILNGFSFLPAFIVTMILGCIMGFLNGYLVMKLRITPVIATLVTLSLFKGIALLIVPDGLSAIKSSADQVMPGWINDYARKEVLFGLPAAFWFAVFIIIVLIVIQRKTILGKYAAATGGNPLAAELSGINPVKIVWIFIHHGRFLCRACRHGPRQLHVAGRPSLGRRNGACLHHRGVTGRDCFLRGRRVGREDNDWRDHNYLCDHRFDDRHPSLLADGSHGQCAPDSSCHQLPIGAG